MIRSPDPRNPWTLLAAVSTLFAFGAQGASAPPPRVISYAADAKAPAQWTVGTSPLVEIGGADGEGPTEFTDIPDVTRQRDGAIWVRFRGVDRWPAVGRALRRSRVRAESPRGTRRRRPRCRRA